MTLRVFFEGPFEFNVFPVSGVLGDQGRSLFLGECKREFSAGFQKSRVTMRDAVCNVADESHGIAEADALRPPPVSLTVLVQR